MRYRAIILPRTGERAEQVFGVDLDEVKKWARGMLWSRCRKLITDCEVKSPEGVQELWVAAGSPRVVIYELVEQELVTVKPWEVTDDDKKPVTGE